MEKTAILRTFSEDFNIKMWLRDEPFGWGLNSNDEENADK